MSTARDPGNQQTETKAGGNEEKNLLAVSSITLGITSLIAFLFFRPLAFIPAIAGVVLGIAGARSPKQRWLAVAGLIISLLVLLGVFGLVKMLMQ